MIFGRRDLTDADMQAFIERQRKWFDHFAILPVQLTDGPGAGRWAWMQKVQRRDWQGGFCYESWYTSYRMLTESV